MNKPVKHLILLLLCTVLASCTALDKKQAPAMDTEKARLFRQFYKKAVYLEHHKDLVEARKNYQLALTVAGSNKAARQSLININKQLQSRADRSYQKSLELRKNGKYQDATRCLLIALRLWPDHTGARQALTADQGLEIQTHRWHTIKKKETLSKISHLFYGTPHQSDSIARANHIQDATRIRPGVKLKIPELKDHPFVNHYLATPSEPFLDIASPAQKKSDSLAMCRDLGMDLFKNRQFENAAIEFKKVLSTDARDKTARVYLSKTYYQMGTQAHADKNFLTAIKNFKAALAYDTCPLCEKEMAQSIDGYKEFHYKAGMKFFDRQDLNMAILEWTLVQNMDPEYKKVLELLDKTKKIQTNMEAIRKAEYPPARAPLLSGQDH